MKLISLNTWGGKLYEPLMEFVKTQSKDTDIFCFQEIFSTSSDRTSYKDEAGDVESRLNLYSELIKILPDFNSHFANLYSGFVHGAKVDFDINFGLACFVRKNIKIISHENINVFKDGEVVNADSIKPRNLQLLNLETGKGKKYAVGNFHGLWISHEGKSDNEYRISQSININKLMAAQKSPKILCGDFNLWPETESLKLLEKGMTNLIKKYKITSTRSSYYPKDIKYADYTLVSPDIKVQDFKVPPEEISDHLPMILTFQ